ncbi:MAG: hypothetical protein KDD60_06070, partial [Bdellovibrionales bacterium]|nr:hypothetical protein [Bdellovibrionales bacterium]
VGIGSGAFSTLDFIRVLHRYGSFPHVIGVDVRPEVLASGYLARSVVLKRAQTVKDAISKGADLSFGQADLMAHLHRGEIPSVTDTVKKIAPEKRVIVVNCANLTSQWWLREEMSLYKEGYQSFISICRDDNPVYIESVVSTAEAVNLRQRVVMDVHVRVPSSGTIIPDINIVLGATEENAVQDVLELNAAVESAMQEAFR